MNKNETIAAFVGTFEEAILAITEAFDEIDRLQKENGSLRAKSRPAYKDAIYEFGRMEIFERAKPIAMPKEGDTVDDFYRLFYSIPDFMSRDEFRAEYDEEIVDLYRQRLTEGAC